MQLTPEQVNEFMAKAILDSQIGDSVKESVNRVLASLKQSYNNPFDEVIRQHVVQAIDKELITNFMPEINEKVRAALTTHLTSELMESIVKAAVEKLRVRY